MEPWFYSASNIYIYKVHTICTAYTEYFTKAKCKLANRGCPKTQYHRLIAYIVKLQTGYLLIICTDANSTKRTKESRHINPLSEIFLNTYNTWKTNIERIPATKLPSMKWTWQNVIARQWVIRVEDEQHTAGTALRTLVDIEAGELPLSILTLATSSNFPGFAVSNGIVRESHLIWVSVQACKDVAVQ